MTRRLVWEQVKGTSGRVFSWTDGKEIPLDHPRVKLIQAADAMLRRDGRGIWAEKKKPPTRPKRVDEKK